MAGAVVLALDTAAPVVVVEASKAVEPPNDWVVSLRANEAVYVGDLWLEDSWGTPFPMGYDRVSPTEVVVRVPSVGVAAGEATLHARMADDVCNRRDVVVPVVVLRPRPWDVVVEVGRRWEVRQTVDHAWDVGVEVGEAFGREQTVDHAWETEVEIGRGWDVTLEMSGG